MAADPEAAGTGVKIELGTEYAASVCVLNALTGSLCSVDQPGGISEDASKLSLKRTSDGKKSSTRTSSIFHPTPSKESPVAYRQRNRISRFAKFIGRFRIVVL